MAIRIEQRPALLGMNIRQPRLELNIQNTEVAVKQSLPALKIEQSLPKVHCDATKCRAEEGLLTSGAFAREMAGKGQANCAAYIAKVVQLGDRMGQIENYNASRAIRDYAVQAWDSPSDFNVTRIPRSPVDVTVQPGVLKTHPSPGQVTVNPHRGSVQGDFQRGQVETYLRQKADIKIQYVQPEIDTYR